MPTDKTVQQRGSGQKAEREALRNLTMAEAMNAQKAMRDAQLAKTKRLRALRLAKEVEESKTSSARTTSKTAGSAKRRSDS